MPKISPSITDAEWRVMHEIWASEPVTSGEIAGRIQENTNWTSGTIKTLFASTGAKKSPRVPAERESVLVSFPIQ